MKSALAIAASPPPLPAKKAEPLGPFGGLRAGFRKTLDEATQTQMNGKLLHPAALRTTTVKTSSTPLASAHTAVASTQSRVASTAHQTTQAALGRSRESADQHATALSEARAGHSEQAQQLSQSRLIDLIVSELKAEAGPDERRPQAANHDRASQPGPSSANAARSANAVGAAGPRLQRAPATQPGDSAEATVELIEKIEAFVKSQRPGLSLTLNNSLGARVDIERIGPREVAIKVVGHNGPPKAEDLGRLRDEMRARGLKVSALSVA